MHRTPSSIDFVNGRDLLLRPMLSCPEQVPHADDSRAAFAKATRETGAGGLFSTGWLIAHCLLYGEVN